ncbi:TetR/AcrR family transcriptional regulator [Novosphingobium naphthalenivorans]|uniref:TetR/AcrR family transcriptional regulator n=1 Tax=Novosphingobium naphthalenivorans TaxID=273168 RepID=UPI000A9BB7A5|nr:TetR/AcrR family transcriptional regulator [Novosphingobium naphthalenivorans]
MQATGGRMVVRVRERNKAEKRERIRLAALKLFSEYGYDATTLRDVAREAHVALGTLSLYAADKRDLTLLVFNEITVSTMEAAIDVTRSREIPFEERILTFFTPFYRDWADNPRLARIFLQINYYSGGMHGEEYTRTRRSIARQLEFMVEDAINRGEIRPPETTDVVAQHFFLIFSATARWWIGGDNPVAEEGIAYLRRLIRLQIMGLIQQARVSTLKSKSGADGSGAIADSETPRRRRTRGSRQNV